MRRRVARNLAAALSSGAWTRAALERRAEQVLGRGSLRALRSLISDLLRQSVTPYAPPPGRLLKLILTSTAFHRAAQAAAKPSVQPDLTPTRFSPLPPFRDLAVPKLLSPDDLAAWLEVSLAHLEWFADEKRQHAKTAESALQHYGYAWLPKRSGPPRLIEAPKPRLKALQRQVLHGILDHLPPHDCAHGFVKGRSCLSAAQRHASESVVVTADLQDFFLNTQLSRVHGLFRCLGYPWSVARILTGLCSTATPAGAFDQPPASGRLGWALRRRYLDLHLPQGAPTSPALANYCAWRLDCRLSGLAAHLNARYTRYADDLAFSGDRDFARRANPFLASVAAIAKAEGFALNHGKTRIMRRGACQRITGLVVNEHLNVPRADFDTLKATLHNCLRHGPESQNRHGHAEFRAHLDGRVTWVENVNPRRGLRLRRMFEGIEWPDGA